MSPIASYKTDPRRPNTLMPVWVSEWLECSGLGENFNKGYLLVWLSPWTFLQFRTRRMCKETCFPAKVHTQVCLYWLILFPLLLKWSLLATPWNSSLIIAVLLANNKYWVNPIFPGFLSVSQNCVTPHPPHTYPKHTAVPFSKPWKQSHHLYTAFIPTS